MMLGAALITMAVTEAIQMEAPATPRPADGIKPELVATQPISAMQTTTSSRMKESRIILDMNKPEIRAILVGVMAIRTITIARPKLIGTATMLKTLRLK